MKFYTHILDVNEGKMKTFLCNLLVDGRKRNYYLFCEHGQN